MSNSFEVSPEIKAAQKVCREVYTWQQRLASGQVSPEEIGRITAEHIPEYDSRYPYVGQPVFITGKSYLRSDDPKTFEHGDEPIFETGFFGLHCGFELVNGYEVQGVSGWELTHAIKPMPVSPDQIQGYDFRTVRYFDADSTIIVANEIDKMLGAQDEPTAKGVTRNINLLNGAAKKLNRLHASKSFRKASRKDQLAAHNRIVDAANDEFNVRDVGVGFKPHRVYVVDVDTRGRRYMRLSTGKSEVAGQILGVESPESQLLRTKRLSSPKDRLDRKTSLFLAMEPDSALLGRFSLQGSCQLIYVPWEA